MTSRSRVLTLVAVLGIGAPSLHAGAPEIDGIAPRAVLPGATTRLRLRGKELGDALELWTGFPGVVEITGGSEDRLDVDVTVPAEIPVGAYALRLVTREGISNPLVCMVDDIATVKIDGAHESPETALRIDGPIAVEGDVREARARYFRIETRAGQTLSLEVWASRLGSSLDPHLRVLDDRRELVVCDDAVGCGEDSRVRLTFPRSGDVLVELRHTRFEGGDEHFFRLRAGDFPAPATVFPLGARIESTTRVRALGGEEAPERDVRVDERHGSRQPVSMRFSRGGPSCALLLEASELPELVEGEIETAPTAPFAINGRFERSGDVDEYAFRAEAGERLEFAGVTRSLGSPSQLLLSILDAGKREIARDDPSGSDDGRLRHRFDSAGRYTLRVEELTHAGGPEHAYRVRLEPAAPAVTLSMTDRIFIPEGRAFETKVTCERDKYEGKITLLVDGLGDGVTLENAVIPAKKNETTLRVTVPEDAIPENVRLMRVRARAEGTDRLLDVSTRGAWSRRLRGLPTPPSELESTAVYFLMRRR